MSYILEALKRSEQERVRGAAPTLHVMHDEPLRESHYPWPYFAVSAALAVLVLLGWQRPWKADAAPAPSLAMEMPIAPPQQMAPPVTMAPPRPAVQSRPAAVAAREEPILHTRKAERSKDKKEKAAAKIAEAKPAKAPTPAMAKAAPPAEKEAPPRKEVVSLSDLPSSVQRTLPKMTISGYINHSPDPSERMVGVGDALLREGEETSSGLKLERIADTNAVFNYKGHRFRVPLP